MMNDLLMLDLLDEERYWRNLVKRANAQGNPGTTFLRCIESIEDEITARKASCGCESCQVVGSGE